MASYTSSGWLPCDCVAAPLDSRHPCAQSCPSALPCSSGPHPTRQLSLLQPYTIHQQQLLLTARVGVSVVEGAAVAVAAAGELITSRSYKLGLNLVCSPGGAFTSSLTMFSAAVAARMVLGMSSQGSAAMGLGRSW